MGNMQRQKLVLGKGRNQRYRLASLGLLLMMFASHILPQSVLAEAIKEPVKQTTRKNFGLFDGWVAKFSDSPSASTPIWTRQFGSSGYDLQKDLTTDITGSTISVGNTTGAIVGTNKGGDDAWIVKYSPTGKLVWKRQWGTTDDDAALSVDTDSDRNIYVAGRYEVGSTEYVWLAKYSPLGALIWRKSFEAPATTVVDELGLAIDGGGNAIIASTGTLVAGNNGDCWIVKYSPTGTRLWSQQVGYIGLDTVSSLALDRNNSIFLTGTTGSNPGGTNQGLLDAWIAKFTARGERQWVKQIGTFTLDIPTSITTDTKGNAVMAGFTNGPLGGPTRGRNDAWLAKYSPNGTFIWKRQLGSLENDEVRSIVADTTGNIFLSGLTAGDLGGTNRGSTDAWAAKYSAAGALVWKKQLGTLSTDAS
ncbi:MAG TPA: SBBP repeat-containing protein, partial [Stenomitos sp.]